MPIIYHKFLLTFYEQLKPFIYEMNTIVNKELEDNSFKPALISAFVKCFEFNYDVCAREHSNDFFYLMPFLRGVCEDLITLKYLNKLEKKDRHDIIMTYTMLLTFESVKAQTTFFKRENLHEPILKAKKVDEQIDHITKLLKDLWVKQGLNKDTIFPSVSFMAKAAKMEALYDFLYHATSRAVHFSPNMLMRLGWSESPDHATFTSKNFSGFYNDFVSYHGAYLFLRYVKEFKKELNLSTPFLAIAKEMKQEFRGLPYCPEIITFEEMNKKRPNNIFQIFFDPDERFNQSLG